MWKVWGAVLILSIVVVGVTFYKGSPPKSITSQPEKVSTAEDETPEAEAIAQNLEVPWALAFLPNQDILITERTGRIRIIKDGQLLKDPVAIISDVKQTGESGLHGIAIHPKYPENPYVYIYYTYSSESNNSLNRVSRFTFENTPGDGVFKDEQVIVDKIPGAVFHDGGRIKFGPDGYLYITTGDAQNPSLSQNKNSLAGKILRVKDGGKVERYSYGHRNPQGITWDNQENLWSTEHGQSATDEINLVEIGKNYGWPTTRGDQKQQGMISPVLHSGSDTWAPAGAAYHNVSIYFGGLRGQALFQFKIDTSELKVHFKGQFGRIRDVVLGPDNMLYITTSNRDGRGNPIPDDDKIIRINPQKL